MVVWTDCYTEYDAGFSSPDFCGRGSYVNFWIHVLAASIWRPAVRPKASTIKRGCNMAKAKVRKCQICGLRPSVTERGFCHDCEKSILAEKRRKREVNTPYKYITYQGTTVALFKDGEGRLKAAFSTRNPDTIPKCRLLDLNVYCPGYSRQQIKKFKRLIFAFGR